MARGTGDAGMQPLAHALSIFVPVYGVWQAYRHFALIDALRRKVDAARGVDALTGAIGTGIWWLTFTHYSSEPIFQALDAIELAPGHAGRGAGDRGRLGRSRRRRELRIPHARRRAHGPGVLGVEHPRCR